MHAPVTATGTATVKRGAATATGTATATIERGAAVIERGAATANVYASLQTDAFCMAAVCIAAIAGMALRDVMLGPHAPAIMAGVLTTKSLLSLLSLLACCAAAITHHRRLQIASQQIQIMSHRMDQQAAPDIPEGTIFAWQPSNFAYEENGRLIVPTGYVACDGTNGTPDLVGKFIRGANVKLNPDKFQFGTGGGSESHTHRVDTKIALVDPWTSGWKAERHVFQNCGEDALQLNSLQNKSFAGKCTEVDHLPPFYTLVYIMKSESSAGLGQKRRRQE